MLVILIVLPLAAFHMHLDPKSAPYFVYEINNNLWMRVHDYHFLEPHPFLDQFSSPAF